MLRYLDGNGIASAYYSILGFCFTDLAGSPSLSDLSVESIMFGARIFVSSSSSSSSGLLFYESMVQVLVLVLSRGLFKTTCSDHSPVIVL